jgi:hypothetical protein
MLENVAELVFEAAHKADGRHCVVSRHKRHGQAGRNRPPPLAVFDGPSETAVENPRPAESHDETSTLSE